MDSRRILITGISSHVGGRLAQALEQHREIEAIVGIDTHDPRHELHRTEFVRVDAEPALIRRIVGAAAIDTVIETREPWDPRAGPAGRGREPALSGIASMLSACEGKGSPIRKVVIRSSAHYYGHEPDSPAFLSEELPREHPPRTALERAVVEAEDAAATFAARNPEVTVTVLRLAEPIGVELRAPHLALLALPAVPAILGFDPRWQFIHEDDVIGVLVHAAANDIPGSYNAAADGVLALSEVASLLGKPLLPVLPPWGTGFAAAQLRRVGLPIPIEMIRQLRVGRGLDNRRLKATGYAYRYTTREAIVKLRAQQRLRPLLGRGQSAYRYERDVEEFLRRSPSVRPTHDSRHGSDDEGIATATGRTATADYDELRAAELIEIISSLDLEALARLRSYEAANQARTTVLEALDRNLARKRRSGSEE